MTESVGPALLGRRSLITCTYHLKEKEKTILCFNLKIRQNFHIWSTHLCIWINTAQLDLVINNCFIINMLRMPHPPTPQTSLYPSPSQTQVNKHSFLCTSAPAGWKEPEESVRTRVLTKAHPFVPVPVLRGQQPGTAADTSLAQPVTRCPGAEQALYIIKATPEPLLGSPRPLCTYP